MKTTTLAVALNQGRPFTSARWRKAAGVLGYVLRFDGERLWFLDFNDPEGQRAGLTRYVRSERAFGVADVLADDYETVDETAIMESAWKRRAA